MGRERPRDVDRLPGLAMNKAFEEFYRCPVDEPIFRANGELSATEGYFTIDGAICYGRCSGEQPSRHFAGVLPEVSQGVAFEKGRLQLPFELSEVVANLRRERYRQDLPSHLGRLPSTAISRRLYYFLRPSLPVMARRHLQRVGLAGWKSIAFPRWPVDVTVEILLETVMALILRSRGVPEIPFIWFWPDGAPGCAIITHDVEGPSGVAFCDELMDLDDSMGFKSSFQAIPTRRYESTTRLVDRVRCREFEVNIHDLNHDGHLFRDRQRFLERATEINRYAREFGCQGFRSGAMYREQDWYDAFEFSYDMSVPNVAHLEPQRGGCCTVMPYYVGDMIELPLTTVQDYSLFHILRDYSAGLWREQIDLILSRNGLISILTHPDYLRERRARAVYLELLTHLAQLRAGKGLWTPLPLDVNRWWRSRSEMSLIGDGDGWRIEGPGSERARVAFARLEGGRVRYRVERRTPMPGGGA